MAFISKSAKTASAVVLAAGLGLGAAVPASADYFQAWEHAGYQGYSTYVPGAPTFVDVPNNTVSSVKNKTFRVMEGRNEVLGWIGASIVVKTVAPWEEVGHLYGDANDNIDWFQKK